MRFDRGSSLTVLRFCSICLRPDYSDFRELLKGFLPRLDQPKLSTTGDQRIDDALEILQRARKGADVVEDQDVVMAEADQPRALVDDVLKTLLHNATEEFGFAPRDAYNGVLDLPSTRRVHVEAVKRLEYSDIPTIIKMFSDTHGLETLSHRVFAVHPRKNLPKIDDWTISFKSSQILRNVMEKMVLEEDRQLRETFGLLRNISGGAPLSVRIFETVVHRILSRGWRSDSGPTPQPIRMISNDKSLEPPTFSTALSPSSATSGTSLSFSSTPRSPSDIPQPSLIPPHAGAGLMPQPIRTVSDNHGPHTFQGSFSSTPGASLSSSEPRTVTRVKFTDLSNVTFEKDKYYTPTATTHPLFGSFIIDVVDDPQTIVISVFQATVSPTHGGSATSYPFIRQIMAHLKGSKPEAKVRVEYFLVCPDTGDEFEYQWKMPAGWNEGTGIHDHRGEAFCIRIPISDRYGTSRLFTSNFAAQLNHDLM
jgi:hypothetical protein